MTLLAAGLSPGTYYVHIDEGAAGITYTISVDVASAVPLPAGMALLLGAFGVLAGYRASRKS